MTKIKKCSSCNSKNVNLLLNLGSTALANSYLENIEEFKKEKKFPLKLYMCKKCKLIQVFHNVKPSEFFINYDYLSGVSSTWKKHCKDYSKKIINRFQLKKKNGSIIEIASNDGVLIENFHKKKFDVIGIEPSKIAHKIARKKGLNSINKFFDKNILKIFKQKKIQLIIANNVIAHVKNINEFVKTMSKISNDKTIITIEFPYAYNLKDKMQYDTIYHEHHYYYSLHSISYLMKNHNLEIFDVEKLKVHGGSYRIYLKKISSKRKITNRCKKYFKFEKKTQINSLNFYKNFQKLVDKTKKNTKDFLNDLKKKGKVVHAYGAAAKGNTFLNFCKISENKIKYIYDLNESKVNKYLPQSHIKIISVNKINTLKPDYILILAWNIFDEISKQLSFTKKWGCKLVRLLPKIEIKS